LSKEKLSVFFLNGLDIKHISYCPWFHNSTYFFQWNKYNQLQQQQIIPHME